MYPEDLMEKVLFTEEDIQKRTLELAKEISQDYKEKEIVLLCTLKGAILFFSDLVKKLDVDNTFEFIRASSYIGKTTDTSGNVRITNATSLDIKNKDVLIVEDIVDTGLTCVRLTEYLLANGAKSVEICTLLDKPSRRVYKDLKPKYVAFKVPDCFILGYGLDYDEKYRNIPKIGVINPKYIK